MNKLFATIALIAAFIVSPLASADANGSVEVVISTSLGNISLKLNKEKAPGTVENFINLVESGYYDETIFHRVIEGFMVQGGGLTADMRTKPSGTKPILNEANNGLSNDRGTIAMARTNDPHSATSQFFINHKNNSFLNHSSETLRGWGYAVFGLSLIHISEPTRRM